MTLHCLYLYLELMYLHPDDFSFTLDYSLDMDWYLYTGS